MTISLTVTHEILTYDGQQFGLGEDKHHALFLVLLVERTETGDCFIAVPARPPLLTDLRKGALDVRGAFYRYPWTAWYLGPLEAMVSQDMQIWDYPEYLPAAGLFVKGLIPND